MNDQTIKKELQYEKPQLRIIELAADEVMGVGCKTAGRTGPATTQAPCSPCLLIGS